MRYIIILVCIFVTISGFNCKEARIQNHVSVVTPKEVKLLLKNSAMQIIDVRTPEEFTESHIKNAKNINYLGTNFSKSISKLNKDTPILIYCHSGKRSSESVNQFLKAGFKKIYNLEGGILKWKVDGLPLVIK